MKVLKKKKIPRYGLTDFKAEFGSDRQCLEFIFESLHSRSCTCGGTFRLITGRRQFQCSRCRHQLAPTVGTIFERSRTPLTLWFHALFVFANAKSGISAKEMERQLGTTYKTAWRALHLIRDCLGPSGKKLSGIVEVDEAWVGGVRHDGTHYRNKAMVMGLVERKGRVRAFHVPHHEDHLLLGNVTKNVRKGTKVMTDGWKAYRKLDQLGYERESVIHSKKEWVRGDVHTNTIEAFFGHLKRSVSGTHKVVSPQHFQKYLDGFSWHWNTKHTDRERLVSLLDAVLLSST